MESKGSYNYFYVGIKQLQLPHYGCIIKINWMTTLNIKECIKIKINKIMWYWIHRHIEKDEIAWKPYKACIRT